MGEVWISFWNKAIGGSSKEYTESETYAHVTMFLSKYPTILKGGPLELHVGHLPTKTTVKSSDSPGTFPCPPCNVKVQFFVSQRCLKLEFKVKQPVF